MCGRYELGLDAMDIQEYLKVIKDIQSIITPVEESREATPGQLLPVVTQTGFEKLKWGYPMDKKLLINARGESLSEKRLFKAPFESSRIIVPAKAYYEWNPDRVKYRVQGEEAMHLAGLRLRQGDENYFVIITTDANEQIRRIHHRMPLLLENHALSEWLYDEGAARALLHPYAHSLNLDPMTPEQLNIFSI